MTVLVGYTPQETRAAALELGVVMARSLAEPLLVTTVVAAPYLDVQAPVDGDYRGLLHQWAERSLAHARSKVPTDVAATFAVPEAPSLAG